MEGSGITMSVPLSNHTMCDSEPLGTLQSYSMLGVTATARLRQALV